MAISGTWRVNKPTGSEPIRDGASWVPDNLEYIEGWFAVEHVFPGCCGENAGHHRPGSCHLMKFAASTQLASMTSVPSGAIAYVTGASAPGASVITHNQSVHSYASALRRFVYSDGSKWSAFDNLLHSIGGSMTGNLDISGSASPAGATLDGRSPSADGKKLDKISAGADAVGLVTDFFMAHGSNLGVPSTPTGADFVAGDCKYMAVQCSGTSGSSTKISTAGGVTCATRALAFCIGVK